MIIMMNDDNDDDDGDDNPVPPPCLSLDEASPCTFSCSAVFLSPPVRGPVDICFSRPPPIHPDLIWRTTPPAAPTPHLLLSPPHPPQNLVLSSTPASVIAHLSCVDSLLIFHHPTPPPAWLTLCVARSAPPPSLPWTRGAVFPSLSDLRSRISAMPWISLPFSPLFLCSYLLVSLLSLSPALSLSLLSCRPPLLRAPTDYCPSSSSPFR